MASNFYLGNAGDMASNMTSIFGGNTTQGTIGPTLKSPSVGGSMEAQQPWVTGAGSGTGSGSGIYNPLAAQAIRPTSFGKFNPQYGQNLATSIGGLFQRPQQNTPLQFNPYGNLTDANVQYPNLGGGNAPRSGLPQTLLQWAQFFNPTALAPQPQQSTNQNGIPYEEY